MCPYKTENLALNVPRPEGQFWRQLASAMGARSRGELQKNLLLIALEKVDRAAARQLKRIRAHHRAYGAAALLVLFCVTLFSHDAIRRAARRGRSETVLSADFAD